MSETVLRDLAETVVRCWTALGVEGCDVIACGVALDRAIVTLKNHLNENEPAGAGTPTGSQPPTGGATA